MKVYAKNAELAKVLVHPVGKVAFREDGSADWPEDQFTARRIRDGDVTTQAPLSAKKDDKKTT